jgi:hypothetical protein
MMLRGFSVTATITNKVASALSSVLLLAGCVMGNKYDYDDSRGSLAYSGQGKRVAVAAWDQRPYVLSGNKQPDFVGLQRTDMGIPFNVVTASKQPLATEMTHSLLLSLAGAGFGAMPVALAPHSGEGDAVRALLRDRPARAVLLRVADWESDTLHNPKVIYDLTLNVYDGAGRKLAGKSLKGSDALQGQLFNPMEKAKQIVPDAFKQKIELLLNAPEIAAALK